MKIASILVPSTALSTDALLSDVYEALRNAPTQSIVLTDDKHPIGILTQRDKVRLIHQGIDPEQPAIRHATTNLIMINADRSFEYALHLMIDHHIRRIIVINDEGDFLGTVTQEIILAQYDGEFLRTKLKVNHLNNQRDPIVALPSTSFNDTIALMVRHNVSMIPIVHDTINYEVAGIFTESDVKTALSQEAKQQPIEHFMSQQVITVREESDVESVIGLMQTHHIKHLLIADAHKRLKGTITLRDLIRNIEGSYSKFLERKLSQTRKALFRFPQIVLELVEYKENYYFHWVNEQAQYYFGKNLVEKSLDAILPRDVLQPILTALHKDTLLIERTLITVSSKTFEMFGTRNADGTTQLIFNDITEVYELNQQYRLKEVEHKLTSAERDVYGFAFENAYEAMLLLLPGGIIHKANLAAKDMLRLPNDPDLMPVMEMIDLEATPTRYLATLENHESIFESTFVNAGTDPLPVEISLKSIRYQKQMLILAVIRSIKERKEFQEKLYQKTLYSRQILDSQSNMIILTDGISIDEANQAFLDFFDVDTKEHFNEDYGCISNFFLEEHGYIRAKTPGKWLEDVLKNGPNAANNRVKMINQLSGQIETFLIAFNHFEGERLRYLITFTNITKLEHYQALLNQQKLSLEKLVVQQSKMAAMGEMIGAIAHQWKQPLNTLGLYFQDLQDLFSEGELNAQYLDEITQKGASQIRYMYDTVEDFRNFFKPDLKPSTFNAHDALNAAYRLIAPQFTRQQITVELVMYNSNPCITMAQNEFKQVIINLLTNARDAFLQSQRLPKKLLIETHHDHQNVTIILSDNAGGIAPEVLYNLFEPYITTKGDSGTGVGLSMSKTIIEKWHGTIHAENIAEGARFSITLPHCDNPFGLGAP